MIRAAVFVMAAALSACATAGAGHGDPDAWFEAPDNSYPHRVLGSIREKRVLAMRDAEGLLHRLDLRVTGSGGNVFEDIAPRLADIDGDGRMDAVVVESSPQLGARLSVYTIDPEGIVLLGATGHIGQPFRWLAPAGIGDLDADGRMDVAIVEAPHLGKTLRVYTWQSGALVERASLGGVSNHRIGDERISGGLRDCAEGPELVLADQDWERIVLVRFRDGLLVRRDTDLPASPSNFTDALACRG